MTFNEFKLFCICFCRKYDGKTFGEIIKDIVPFLRKVKISIKNTRIDSMDEVYFRVNGCVLFGFLKNKIQYIKHINNDKISALWSDVDMTLFDFEDIV